MRTKQELEGLPSLLSMPLGVALRITAALTGEQWRTFDSALPQEKTCPNCGGVMVIDSGVYYCTTSVRCQHTESAQWELHSERRRMTYWRGVDADQQDERDTRASLLSGL